MVPSTQLQNSYNFLIDIEQRYKNDMNLREAEDIKKTWQEYTEELYKKGLNDLDNHDGVVTHLEPDQYTGV